MEVLLVLYLGASLLHFTHNAEFAQDYPNLPDWVDRSSVYLTWLGITAGGVLGYVLFRLGSRVLGLIVLCLYAAAGLDGLLHYTLAPMGAHTHGMNFTIWFEVVVASVLLLYLLTMATRRDRVRAPEWVDVLACLRLIRTSSGKASNKSRELTRER
ncbi:MAG: hypothetical protein EOO77_07350 [Oxalobacteraceae bacterium]|nr:MAG: hypothetical protein EOO77_07350 [Oxalobacteraceae bacterium]